MPKVEIDYSNTIIYKITCKDPSVTDVYVGHTTNFVQRKHAHKQSCNNDNCKLYKVIRDNGGWQNWKMEIVNFFNCHDHYEARKKEQEYFTLLNATLNSIEPLPKPKGKKAVIKCTPKPKPTYELSNKMFYNEKLYEDQIKISPKIVNKFICLCCHYSTSNKFDYEKHLSTQKHKTRDLAMNVAIKSQNYACSNCDKIYKDNTGLWRHNKKCKPKPIEDNQVDVKTIDMKLIMYLLKQNDDFKKLMVEQNNKMIETIEALVG